jgi:hypothetical protein
MRVQSACSFALAVLVVVAGESFAGFEPLFNGEDLSGWTQRGGDPEHRGTFHVEDGAIVGTYVAGTSNTFLTTDRWFGDFVLEFEFFVVPGVNSGVQFRSQTIDHENHVAGYQFEIDPSTRAWTAGIYHEGGRQGWMYPVEYNPPARELLRVGAWNAGRIECVGNSLRTWLNGAPVAHVIDEHLAEGFVGLQVHGLPDGSEAAGRTVRWRNIRIDTTPAPAPPEQGLYVRSYLANALHPVEAQAGWALLFEGTDTSAWRGTDGTELPNAWRAGAGMLIVEGGGKTPRPRRADLVTRETFGAFELQLDFVVTPGGNSGIKYLVTDYGSDGAPSYLGLEYQILDDRKHPDAKKGVCGNRTMASLYDLIPSKRKVHGRTVPRKVDDWNHARIVCRADGTVEHWLNGFRVVEYTRGSPAYAGLVEQSKYKGLASFGLAPEGHILLQDHGDEVHFRSIKIRRLD